MNADFFSCVQRRKSAAKNLLDELAGTAPARVDEKVADDRQPGVGRAFIVGPVNKHRAADDEIARYEAPVTTVFAVVPIVAHHEVTIRRHSDLVLALKDV